MTRTLLSAVLIGLLASCSQKPAKIQAESIESKLKNEALVLARDYASKQLKNPATNTDGFGIIILKDDVKQYRINPSKIFIGPIDEDASDDILVTIDSNYKQDLGTTEQLVLLNSNGNLRLERVFELDMKVVKLKDRVITGELHTKPRTSPLYNCGHCIEIANYQYKNGDLVKLK